MSNGYRARIYPRDTGIWSSPTFSVHCIVSLHCSASQISSLGGGGTIHHSRAANSSITQLKFFFGACDFLLISYCSWAK